MFGVISLRLVWIQVVKAGELSAIAAGQRSRNLEIPARRGTIYDREGEPLAVSVEARTVVANPSQVDDPAGVAAKIAETIGGNAATYEGLLRKNSGYVRLASKVDLNRAKQLEKLGIDGIAFEDDFKRTYPSGELACQILGVVGSDRKGLEGIEAQYDDLLAGRPGAMLGEQDRRGNPIPGSGHAYIEPEHGKDIVLTIDKDIQYEAQVALTEAVQRYEAVSGSIVVMNPRNGEVYAMASTPSFNPNEISKATPAAIRNRSVTDAYEPGSTLKCLTAAAVIEKGYYTPESRFSLPPTIKVANRVIHESHGRGTVDWSLTDIVTHSSNVGTVKLGMKLGEQGLYDALSEFGLTERPGIDFPGQTKGWLPPVAQWSKSSIGNIPFGQGVSVTQLQLARAVGALANEGILTTPHLLMKTKGVSGESPVWPTRAATDAETARKMTGILRSVVTSGTGTAAAVPGYAVAGKTGTAQKALPNGGGYVAGKYVGSFIGYLPAEDPQVLVCVTIDEPKSGYYGGTCAAPTFARVSRFAVQHLKIPPASSAASSSATKGVGTVSEETIRD